MASWLDDIDAFMKEIKAHLGEEALFSVIPAAAGAFLSRRHRSGLGAPLGALLMGLGGVGAYLDEQREFRLGHRLDGYASHGGRIYP